MRFPRVLSLVASLGLAACGGGGGDFFDGGGGPAAPQTFLLTTTAANRFISNTLISHPDLDGNPDALLLATPIYDPPGSTGIALPIAIGVEWIPGTGEWSVFREDSAVMPLGAAFVVTILPSIATNFSHRSTATSVVGNTTYLDHPATNANQPALVLITHVAGDLGGVRDARNLGVKFNTARGQWGIFHEDGSAMDVGQVFFVCVLPTTDRSYVHTRVDSSSHAALSNPHLDGRPAALFHVTQNYNPTGVVGTPNDHPIGVHYREHLSDWTVFNQDSAVMSVGTSFNIWIPVS